jgi:uncharacterized protein RhaS with RHS repeats
MLKSTIGKQKGKLNRVENNVDPTRNSFQLANARTNTYTPALAVQCIYAVMLAGKPTVVWIDGAGNRTSANGTVTPYTFVTLRWYVTAECAIVYSTVGCTKLSLA